MYYDEHVSVGEGHGEIPVMTSWYDLAPRTVVVVSVMVEQYGCHCLGVPYVFVSFPEFERVVTFP